MRVNLTRQKGTDVKLIPIQEAYKRLFERQASIPELELHANGHCAHVGKLSPGCLKCFVADNFYVNFAVALATGLPTECQADCPYCADDKSTRAPKGLVRNRETPWEMPDATAGWLRQHVLANGPNCVIPSLSFSGGGDPLQHFDIVRSYMNEFVKEIGPQLPQNPWYFLYTNGLGMTEDRAVECRDIGLDEVRFHLGASNFSELVYENMEVAAKVLNTVTVETPAWPPHRKKLFEMLPRLEDIGVKHLNLGQIELNIHNKQSILKAYPEGEFYQVHTYQMDDGGLVYDLIGEVVEKGYSYSVLDCNGLVKAVQRGIDCGVPVRDVAHDATDLENLADFEKWERKQKKVP